MISIYYNRRAYNIGITNFSDGAISLNISSFLDVYKDGGIYSILVSPLAPVAMVRDVIEQTVDALYQAEVLGYCTQIFMPYLPYARADRVFTKGDSLPLKLLVNWIVDISERYSLPPFSILEPHNFGAIPENLQRYFHVDYLSDAIDVEDFSHITSVVAPDAGALGRAKQVADKLGVKVSAVATKSRDLTTGKITGYELQINSGIGVQPLVVDDICDGGATFLFLADAIKQADNEAKPHLLLAFGIFSNPDNIPKLQYAYKTISAIYDWEPI